MEVVEERWEQMARVAKGLQLDAPVNWPHYADEAARLVEERDRYKAALGAIIAWRGPRIDAGDEMSEIAAKALANE